MTKYSLRPYQERCLFDCIQYIEDKKNTKKVIVIQPVGSGKSLVIAAIADYVKEPVIVLCPNKEILQQDYLKFTDGYGKEASVYSASLNSRELGHVTFATIGSIKTEINKIKELGIKLLIYDECHQASKNESQLAKFIAAIGIQKVIGLSATPCELGSWDGQSFLKMITRSRKNLFQNIIHCTQVKEVVDGGYWTNLIYEKRYSDTSKLKLNTTGSDYTEKSLDIFYEENTLKDRILNEVNNLKAEGRKSILIFVPSIAKAEEVSQFIPNSVCVHSKTPQKERDYIIKEFKNLQIPVCINVGVLLTGFDHPQLDTTIMARPTNSFVIHYQAFGRIVRPHPEKKDGKIIDFSGNFTKFGRLEDISFKSDSGRWGMFSGDTQLTIGEVEKEKKDEFDGVIWFGKFRGKQLLELPKSYLEWMIKDFRADSPKVKAMLKRAEEILAKN